MTLSISVFETDPDSGRPGPLRLLEGETGLAGFEATRTELWGSETVSSLGARFLPRLAVGDLWVQKEQLDEFRAECVMLLQNAESVSQASRWDVQYVSTRLHNFIAAAQEARRLGGGLVID